MEDHHTARRQFDRRLVSEVRRMAREILAGLAKESGPAAPTGMEMLMGKPPEKIVEFIFGHLAFSPAI